MTGDSRYTQNTQINKVIGENEKCVFYFMGKTKWTFWPTQSKVEAPHATLIIQSQSLEGTSLLVCIFLSILNA